jgi:site-specific recombinase XerD
VDREDLKGLIAEMGAKGLSRGSIKLAVAPIRELCNHAIDDGHPLQNPAARMGRFLKDKTDRRLKIIPLTTGEVQRLLAAAEAQDLARAEDRVRDAALGLPVPAVCGEDRPEAW